MSPMQEQPFVPFVRGVVAASLVAACLVPTVQAQEFVDLYVAITDANGAPVLDVRAEELAMIEDGVRGSIVHVEQLDREFDVTLLLDNGLGMGSALADMRTGVRGFAAALPQGTRLSILTLAPQPRWLQRETDDRRRAAGAVDRLTPDDSMGRFLDALVEAGGRLESGSDRIPVIVAIGSTSPDASSSLEQHFRRLAQRVVEHSAIVHVAILTTGATSGRQVQVSSPLQAAVGLELARLTGGRYEPIGVSSRLVTLLPEIADTISLDARRYHIRARRPEGARGALGEVGLGITRPGVTIRSTLAAPTR
jgi:hypothetical protein